MKSTSSLSLAAHRRDLRIDFARGLALWLMLVYHIPHTIVALFSVRDVAFVLCWLILRVEGSLHLYMAALWFGLSSTASPEVSPSLNTICWQLLFVLGAYLALSGAKLVQEHRTVRILAFSYLAFALVVTLAARDPLSLGPDVVTRAFVPTDRENLGPFRLLHLLAIALLFSRLVPAKWEGFQSKLLQPILKCSDEWLACFCAGVFLSSAGYFVLITSPDSELLQVLVSVTAVSMMT